MKKIIGLFLTLALLCSTCLTGLAANYNDDETNKNSSLKSEFECRDKR